MTLVVGPSPGKGRGVFAGRRFREGETLEEAPVIVVPGREIEHLERTVLQDYYFLWGDDEGDAALLLGICALCNHSYRPNAVFRLQPEAGTIRFVALRDIEAGEEITTNYNGAPDNDKRVWFDAQP